MTHPVRTLAVIGFLSGVLVSSGDLGSIDTRCRLGVTHSLWTDSPPVDPGLYPDFGIVGRGGTLHAHFGIGQSLLMLPADVLATSFVDAARLAPAIAERVRVAAIALFTFPLVSGAVLAVAFLVLTGLGFAAERAFAGALALQFLTTVLHFTQTPQENSLLLLSALSGVALALRGARANSALLGVLAGCATGFGVLVRLPAVAEALFALALAVFLAMHRERGARVGRFVVCYLGALALFISMDRAYHWWRFGEVFGTYIHLYGAKARNLDPTLPASFPFNEPLRTGVVGFLASPHRSLFLFDPLVLLTIVLSMRIGRRMRAEVAAFLVGSVALLATYVAFYARYVHWEGGTSWGPRFVLVPVQLVALLAVPILLEEWALLRRASRGVSLGVLLLALTIQLESVVFWSNLEEAQREHRGRPTLVVWQRAVNVAAVATGGFHASRLAYPSLTQRHITPNFLVFLAGRSVPQGWARLLQAAWGTCIALLAWFVSRAFLLSWKAGVRAVCDSSDTPGPCASCT